jgi:hypothetical protein
MLLEDLTDPKSEQTSVTSLIHYEEATRTRQLTGGEKKITKDGKESE